MTSRHRASSAVMPLSRRGSEAAAGPSGAAAAAAGSPVVPVASASSPSWGPGFSVPSFSASQTSSQQQDVDEQRLSELLKPIKDLTVNWEVPLSRYLEEYIEGLGLRHLSTKQDGQKVNFVEAALLLQGTASVYSKKVEFLWQNTLKMLDMLASQKALEEATEGGTGAKGGRRRKGPGHDFNDFRQISVEMSKTINMKEDGTAPSGASRDRKAAALNFISVTPRQLIEKESRDAKAAVQVSLFTSKGGHHKDLIGHKEDFRVNAQFSLTTATVGEELNEECDLGQHSVSLFEDSVSFMETSLLQPTTEGGAVSATAAAASPSAKSSPGAVLSASTSQDPASDGYGAASDDVPGEPEDLSMGDDLGPGGLDDDNDLFVVPEPPPPIETPVPEPEKTSQPDTEREKQADDEVRRSTRTRRNKLQESLEEPRAPLTEPWEPVKPEDSMVPPKPVKKGKTCRVPKGSQELLQNQEQQSQKYKTTAAERRRKFREKQGIPENPYRVKVVAPIEEYLIREHTSLNKCKHVEPEFRDKAIEVERQRKKARAEAEKENMRGGDANAQKEEDEEEDKKESEKDADGDGNVAEDDGWEDFAGGDMGGDLGGADDDEGDIEDEGSRLRRMSDAEILNAMLPEGEGGDANTAAAKGAEEGGSSAGAPVSYEELVIKRVSEYVQQSQEYIESTDLAKRVSKWHERIRPRLDAVERRGNFDIHRYGSDIIGAFPPESSKSPSKETPARRRKTTVGFDRCVEGKDKEEVCRYFLSALMLANTYNIELGVAGGGVTEVVEEEADESKVKEPSPNKSTASTSKLARKRGGGRKRPSSSNAAAVGKSGLSMEELPMDNVEITLLSTVRHHEELMGLYSEERVGNSNGVGGSDSEEEDEGEDDYFLPDESSNKRKRPPPRQKAAPPLTAKGKAGKGAKVKNSRKRKLVTVDEEEEEEEADAGAMVNGCA